MTENSYMKLIALIFILPLLVFAAPSKICHMEHATDSQSSEYEDSHCHEDDKNEGHSRDICFDCDSACCATIYTERADLEGSFKPLYKEVIHFWPKVNTSPINIVSVNLRPPIFS